MAIYGIGAYYDQDVSREFIKNSIVGIGWDVSSAPELYEYVKSLKVGDVIYIKASAFGSDITVKAIGIIKDNIILGSNSYNGLVKIGRNVKWICTKEFTIKRPNEKNNVRSNTLYEEFHPLVQARILQKF